MLRTFLCLLSIVLMFELPISAQISQINYKLLCNDVHTDVCLLTDEEVTNSCKLSEVYDQIKLAENSGLLLDRKKLFDKCGRGRVVNIWKVKSNDQSVLITNGDNCKQEIIVYPKNSQVSLDHVVFPNDTTLVVTQEDFNLVFLKSTIADFQISLPDQKCINLRVEKEWRLLDSTVEQISGRVDYKVFNSCYSSSIPLVVRRQNVVLLKTIDFPCKDTIISLNRNINNIQLDWESYEIDLIDAKFSLITLDDHVRYPLEYDGNSLIGWFPIGESQLLIEANANTSIGTDCEVLIHVKESSLDISKSIKWAKVFPNPTESTATVQLYSELENEVHIYFRGINGDLLYEINPFLKVGSNLIPVDNQIVKDYNGLILIEIRQPEGVTYLKLVNSK